MTYNATHGLHKPTFSRIYQVTEPCCNSQVLSVRDSAPLLKSSVETLQRNIHIYTSGSQNVLSITVRR